MKKDNRKSSARVISSAKFAFSCGKIHISRPSIIWRASVLILFISILCLWSSPVYAQMDIATGTEVGERDESHTDIQNGVPAESIQNVDNAVNAQSYVITLKEVGDQISLHTDVQSSYLADSIQNVVNYGQGKAEKSKPKSVTLSWSVSPNADTNYSVSISTSQSLSPCETYTTRATSQEVINLELGRTYYWQVSFTKRGTTYYSGISSFTTERIGPRLIDIDGITNVRDLGGYITCEGKIIKQGRLYRCSKLNKNYSTEKLITQTGINEFVNRLKIKSEIDLRDEGENGNLSSSPLGSSVSYKHIPFDWHLLVDDNRPCVKQFFEYLAVDEHYPIAFHCAIGTDRTGYLSYLLEGLLGVSEVDMIKDYLFSSLASIDGSRQISDIMDESYPALIHAQEGDTLQQKVYHFLHDEYGVSTDTLDTIIRLNTEEQEESDNYLTVSTAQEFYDMQPGKKYRLTGDISINKSYNNTFLGILDGDGFTVTTTAPLFNNLSGVVKNMIIEGNISVSGSGGSLASSIQNAWIENVTNLADVTAAANAGGLVGEGSATSVFTDCSNYGNVTGATVGGAIGSTTGALTLSNCNNYGAITSNSTAGYAGGLTGKCSGSAFIQQCSNTGSIDFVGLYAGGIAGYMDTENVLETFISCLNEGTVTYTETSGKTGIGGIAGHLYGGSYYVTISDCSNKANLVSNSTGEATLAGLCSYIDSEILTIKNCFVSGLMGAKNSTSYSCCTLFYDQSSASDGSDIEKNSIDNIIYTETSENDVKYSVKNSSIYFLHFQKRSDVDPTFILALYKDGKMLSADVNTIPEPNQLRLFSVPYSDSGISAKLFYLSSDGFYPVSVPLSFDVNAVL